MANLAYSVERTYPVEPRALWRAWTDVSALEQWCAPTELSVVPGSVVSDPVEGGRWAVAVDATAYGHIAYFWGRYTTTRPATTSSSTWRRGTAAPG
ncbi:MAG: SRPBCC domain-containing protein [Actinomycetota bacterium]